MGANTSFMCAWDDGAGYGDADVERLRCAAQRECLNGDRTARELAESLVGRFLMRLAMFQKKVPMHDRLCDDRPRHGATQVLVARAPTTAPFPVHPYPIGATAEDRMHVVPTTTICAKPPARESAKGDIAA